MSNITLRTTKGSPLTHEELDNNLLNISVPAGAVFYFAMINPPDNYLVCDGSEISRDTYSNLFESIGEIFGSGDGISTFNIPDLRGQFIRSIDLEKGIDIDREFGSEQSDAFQGHYHDITHRNGNPLQRIRQGLTTTHWSIAHSATGSNNDMFTAGPCLEGENGVPRISNETRPKNITLLPCIKY